MAEIRQSKVNKTLILSTCHICSVTPITSAHVHVLGHPFFRCQIAVHLMISLKQWRSAIGCFPPVVGCELNARVCKHDVTRFISLFQFGCFILSVEALQIQFTAKVCILVQHCLM